MNFKYTHIVKQVFAAALTAMLLAGCGKGIPIASDSTETKAYTKAQSMIIVATERNRYQSVYTSQIWGVELPDGGTFESYLLGQVKGFLQEMKMMTMLAEAKEVIITSAEKEELRKLSEAYYAALTEEDLAYMGASEEDVRTMYEEYFLSNKVVEELTKDMDLEISDSEAKVITVEEIIMSDEATAAEVLNQVNAEGADFESIAKSYSEETEIERQIGRGERSGPVEEAAFALTSGQISGVVEDNGLYHIIKCISDYDEDATQARKDSLYQKRKKAAFDQIYNQFKAENPITFNDDIWEDITFSISDKTTTANFFELYRQYFPG